MRWFEFKVAFMLILGLISIAIPASAGTAERFLPSVVDTGEEFQIIVNVADYGEAGQFLEKLPQGFTFIGSSLPNRAITVNGDKISFLLINEKSFNYTLKAPSSAGNYRFVGFLRDINKAEIPVFPVDSNIEVRIPAYNSSGSSSDGFSDGSSSGGSSSGSSDSSSGSGTGSSPELQKNVEAKERSKKFITNGQHVKFEFPKGSTCIKYVEFDSRKTLGDVTTIVEMLKSQSSLVSTLPAGTVYKYINIWVGTGGIANADNVENGIIGFKVEKAWLGKNGNNSSAVSLSHYDGIWSKLETQKIDEDKSYSYFNAKTPGFGHFVIVASNESKDMKASDSNVNSTTPADLETEVMSGTEKPTDKGIRSVPGFESSFTICILEAVFCIKRRKL